MRKRFVLCVVGFLVAASAPAWGETLDETLARVKAERPYFGMAIATPNLDVGALVSRAAAEGWSGERLVGEAASRFGLDRDSADEVVTALARGTLATWRSCEVEERNREMAEVIPLLRSASRRTRGAPVVLAVATYLMALSPPRDVPALLEMAKDAPDPARAVFGAFLPWAGGFSPGTDEVGAFLLSRELRTAREVYDTLAFVRHPGARVALARRALAMAPGPALEGALRRSEIDDLLKLSLAREAAARWAAVPRGERRTVLALCTGRGDDERLRHGQRCAVADFLVGALALEGDAAGARLLLDARPETSSPDPDPDPPPSGAVLRDVALGPLDPSGVRDPFPSLVAWLKLENGEYHGGLMGRLFRRYARAFGFEEEAERNRRADRGTYDPGAYASGPAPVPPLSPAERALALRLAAEAERAAEPLPAPEAAASDPAADLVARLLAQPRLAPFHESKMPEALRGVPAREIASVKLPRGYGLVRAERDGDAAWAVALSQELDPTGEVSGGAYWLLHSTDGGATWGKPLYTGLQQYRPYVIKATSPLPLVRGDALLLSAEIRELDERSITFPPVGLKTRREVPDLLLEAPLEALERDSDGDGLTDLEEERLATDPFDPDTDHDGIPDGADAFPLVPEGAPPSEEGRALAALIDALSSRDTGAIVTGLAPAGSACGVVASDVPARAGRTLFVEGERTSFAGLSAAGRVIVLSEGEMRTLRARFGPTYGTALHVVLDREKKRGYATWDAAWTGGSARLEKVDGRWVVTLGPQWIT